MPTSEKRKSFRNHIRDRYGGHDRGRRKLESGTTRPYLLASSGRRLVYPRRVLPFDEALKRVLALAVPLGAERVPVPDACGRVLAEDVLAPVDLPSFDGSAMDGYALRAADLEGAGPFTLDVRGESRAGGASLGPLARGSACRIFTGAELPPGADAIVIAGGRHARRRAGHLREEAGGVALRPPARRGSRGGGARAGERDAPRASPPRATRRRAIARGSRSRAGRA